MANERLFELVYLLQSRGSMTAQELAERFEVSTRTIRRDVDALSGAGIPIVTQRGAGGGISLLPGFVLDRSTLTQNERSEMLAGLRSMASLGGSEAGSALTKLGGLYPEAQPSWLEADFSPWGSGPTQKRVFDTLKTAILQRRQVRFTYYGASGPPTQRTVDPVRMVYKASAWYVQAFCRLRGEMRTFKVCRITAAALLADTFALDNAHLPPPVEVQDCPSMVHLELLFSPEAAHRVYDLFDPEMVTARADGRLFVTASYPNDGWVRGMLLGFGEDVVVLSPPSFQRELAAVAKKILQNYSFSE